MNKSHLLGAMCACIFISFSPSGHTALIDIGGGMIYDEDLDITWLADANYAKTNGDDADGLMPWDSAVAWADQLVFGGHDDWRLPTTSVACTGYNCTGSELSHLFYDELGGVAGSSLAAVHNSNYDLFTNIELDYYWSGTEGGIGAWSFLMFTGYQYAASKIVHLPAWAVRTGNAAIVPVPAAVWLFGSGLLGLIGIAKRKS